MKEEDIKDMEEPLIAMKDHIIHQNENHFVIKKGDDLGHIPENYHQTLKTEKVIQE